MSKKTRRRLDAGLKAKVALEALRKPGDGCRAGSKVPASPQPDLRLEKAAARRRGCGFLRRDWQGGEPGRPCRRRSLVTQGARPASPSSSRCFAASCRVPIADRDISLTDAVRTSSRRLLSSARTFQRPVMRDPRQHLIEYDRSQMRS